MINHHIDKRNKFLEDIISKIKDEYLISEALRIFLENSREFRKIHPFQGPPTGNEYDKYLNREFEYQKEKVMEYIKNG